MVAARLAASRGTARRDNSMPKGRLPKWPTGSDCKSDGIRLRGFESLTAHCLTSPPAQTRRPSGTRSRGVAQLGRALASGARGRRFKSCHPDSLEGPLEALPRRTFDVLGVLLGPARPARAAGPRCGPARLVDSSASPDRRGESLPRPPNQSVRAPQPRSPRSRSNDPYGIRTRVLTLKGWCPGPG